MHVTLVDPRWPIWRRVLGAVAAIVIFPFTILLVMLLRPFNRPVKRSAHEVAKYLRDFVDGTGGDWDFDDFTSIPIADPVLDSLRERASAYNGPGGEIEAELFRVLEEAEALAMAEKWTSREDPTRE